MPVTPALPRFVLDDDGQVLRFTIPSRKNWFALIVSIPWLAVWTLGECIVLGLLIIGIVSLVATLSTGKPSLPTIEGAIGLSLGGLFLLVWISVWTTAGISVIYSFLWQVVGKEVIEVSLSSIKLSRRIFRFGRPKEYLAEHIRDLRAQPPFQSRLSLWEGGFWGWTHNTMAFDYGARTVRFASSIDEAEAKLIRAEIEKRYPHYCRSTDAKP
jgi:hypothetical protein